MSGNCLMVLGMHRSGTSCLTGTVEQCGVHLGEVFTENPHNKKGNRESAAVQALNNEILDHNGGNWDQPVLVSRWNDDHIRQRESIIESLQSTRQPWWGFKDPRVVFTLPFWLEGVQSPAFLATFRHPAGVARSLYERDEMPLERGFSLWLSYNLQLLAWHDRFGFELVDFDVPDEAYIQQVSLRLAKLGLAGEKERPFFDPALRHQTLDNTKSVLVPDEVLSVYRQLQVRCEAQ